MFRRSDGEDRSRMDVKAISFGSELTHHTKNAILRHSKVPVGGYTGFGLNVEEPCAHHHMEQYKLVIPSRYGVPHDDAHDDYDLAIDLYRIRCDFQTSDRAL
jgi:hypothetical protein